MICLEIVARNRQRYDPREVQALAISTQILTGALHTLYTFELEAQAGQCAIAIAERAVTYGDILTYYYQEGMAS